MLEFSTHSSEVIRAIQTEYLDLLKQHLTDDLKPYLRFAAANPSIMHCLYVRPETSARFEIPRSGGPPLSPDDYRTQRLVDDILDFWIKRGDELLNAISVTKGLATSVFTESTPLEPFKKYGLYFDMICIEDRIFSDASAARIHSQPMGPFLYGAFRGKHLGLLLLEPLIKAQIDPPLVVIYPDPHALLEFRDGPLLDIALSAKDKTFTFFRRLFPKITTADELPEFFSRRIGARGLAVPERCPFLREMSDGSSVKNLARRYAFQTTAESSQTTSPNFESLKDERTGWNIFRAVNTKIYQQERMNLFFSRCRADPLLDDLSWPIFKWDLASQATDRVNRAGLSSELAIPKVLERPNLKWLGNIEIEDLVELHQSNKMTELRQILDAHRREIRFAAPTEFASVFERVADSINTVVEEYERVQQSAIRKLALKRGATYGMFLVSGGLAIASIALPALLPLAIASTVVGMTIGSSLSNIVDDHLSGAKSKKELGARPLGILLKTKRRAEEKGKDRQKGKSAT